MFARLLLFSIVLFPCALFASDADITERDQWFNGSINNQPAMHAHEVVLKHANGERTTNFSTKLRIARVLFGMESVIQFEQKRSFREDPNGNIISFQFEDNEDGKITTAVGSINGQEVTATIARATGTSTQTLTIPAGQKIYGQLGAQRLMQEQIKAIGSSITFVGVEMISGRLTMVTSTATLKDENAVTGDKVFDIRIDLMPMLPITLTVDKNGFTKSMHMSMGGLLKIHLQRTDKPFALEAANFDIKNMLKHKGPIPRVGSNRYKLSEDIIKHIEADDFQIADAAVLQVNNRAQKTELADKQSFLKAEPQLEIENAQLNAWAKKILANNDTDSIAARAELLRLAVRAHITKKDLSQGDATALETFESRCGDCTEHANLLCAALRINGIPARTEIGFVFATDVGSWVGHAWNSAYDSEQGRWIHLDAAYPGIQRSQYIKIAASSGGDAETTGKAMATGMTVLMGQEIEVLIDE